MKRHTKGAIAAQARQIVAGLLCLALLAGVFPWLAVAQAVSPWVNTAEDYLRQMVDWRIMRGDLEGNLNPENDITRAEFVAMVNRAYGYKHIAGATTPFVDVPTNVPEKDIPWYADDVATAYRMGYIKGTSESEFSPEDKLTREQAVVIIGRNMMLAPALGEVLAFNDGRDFSDWSRGWIQTCAEVGVAIGYEDGSFRPQQNITRGEVAAMLVRALGNLINDQGETTLGHVPGNVTINTSNTALKDTVIAGDLYLTGGIELGDVLLDNVTVLGRIVAIGAGEGNDAQSSIVLRNCRAAELVVDSIAKQFASIRTEGNSVVVDKTTVRTEAYLEDRTGTGLGMKLINIESDTGINVQLAGNIKDVFNYTPNSVVTVARGVADKVSVDEKATNSKVEVLNGARVKDLNLDVGTTVTGNSMGTGDIDRLHVYSDGSVVEQLPNTIDVRPGVTATVNGQVMDTSIAAESSENPRLLAGYPEARNVAPTTAEAVFSANKAGTVYWAVTAVADGSVSKADLLKPPAYSSRIIASGTTRLDASGKESVVKLSKLTMDGSYYISAILVDDRKQESPIKVTAFTTPDNSAPAFAKGYPAMGEITSSSGQVKIMATKTCQLYYAILPKGSTAPTLNDFRTGAISGSLGHGTRPAVKNAIDLFNVNSRSLQEQTEYDVYLCLYDADGGKSSNVAKLTFKTADGTPPVLTGPIAKPQATSVQLSASMNEAGTLYWVVVEAGKSYPVPLPGQTGIPSLSSETAKNAVMMGIGGLKSGSVKATANRTFTFTPSGLDKHSFYDLYYLAVDSAGNSRAVQKMRINTIDSEPPTVSLEFTSTDDEAGRQPNASTGLRVVFSERVKAYADNIPFLEKYTAMANETDPAKKRDLKEEWGELVKEHITLMQGDPRSNNEVEVSESRNAGAWVDYKEVTLREEGNNLVFIFGDGTRNTTRAVQLISGGKYYFRITDVRDLADQAIDMKKPSEPYRTAAFNISIARVELSQDNLTNPPDKTTESEEQYVRADMWFRLASDNKAKVEESLCFDVLLWSKGSLTFNLYGRVLDKDGKAVTNDGYHLLGDKKPTETKGEEKYNDYGNGWVKLGTQSLYTDGNVRAGMSITRLAYGNTSQNITFANLKDFIEKGYVFEFAIQRVGTEEQYKRWSDQIKVDVEVVAGSERVLQDLASSVSDSNDKYGQVQRISQDFSVERQFQLLTTPDFATGYPRFSVDTKDNLTTLATDSVDITVQLERANGEYNVHYVLGIVDRSTGKQNLSTKIGTKQIWPVATFDDEQVPHKSGEVYGDFPLLSSPEVNDILPDGWKEFTTNELKYGTISIGTGENTVTVRGLTPNQSYFAYFVIQSKRNTNMVSRVFCYQFKTAELKVPSITMPVKGATVSFTTAADADKLDFSLIAYKDLPTLLKEKFSTYADSKFTEDEVEDKVSDTDKKKDGDNKTFSVMDALMSTVPGENLTYFDKYAKRADAEEDADRGTIRIDIAQLARAEGNWNNNLIGSGSISNMREGVVVSRNTANDIWADKKDAMKNVPYYCLAVARNDSGECYAMVSGVREPKTEVPEIKSVSTQISGVYDTNGNRVDFPEFGDNGEKAGQYLYTGQMTINFTEPVYFLDADGYGSAVRVAGVTYDLSKPEDSMEDNKDNPGKYVYLENHVAPTFNYVTNKNNAASTTFTIKFDKIQLGSQFTMFNNGSFANEDNVPNRGLRLELVLEALPYLSQMMSEKPVVDIRQNMPAFTIYRSPQSQPK